MRLTGEIMKIITCFKLVPEEHDIVVTPEYTLNFDNADAKIGRTINGLTVRNIDTLERFCNLEKPTMAVLCVPRSAVESLSDRLYALGIRCFWNFSHYDINARYNDTMLEKVHLIDSLMTLCDRMNNN